VAGNVAGAGVGVVEAQVVESTRRSTHPARGAILAEEKMADGRTVLVPENFLVDKNGQIIRKIQ